MAEFNRGAFLVGIAAAAMMPALDRSNALELKGKWPGGPFSIITYMGQRYAVRHSREISASRKPPPFGRNDDHDWLWFETGGAAPRIPAWRPGIALAAGSIELGWTLPDAR